MLTVLTYRGRRAWSRVLVLHMLFNVTAYVTLLLGNNVEIYMYAAYGLSDEAYFFIGAIKLWRIKELPTRFTDPPTEEPAHH